MTDQPFSNEVALRIGLAARCLPTIELFDLIEVLQNCVGDQLDETALSKITVTQLKDAFAPNQEGSGDEPRDHATSAELVALKDAVRILWGEQSEQYRLPELDAYTDGDMPGSVRIAVASNTGEQVDGHFGSALRFLVYQVSADELRLVDIRSTLEADLSNDKNGFRVELVSDCAVLYTVSIGGPAAAKVIKADVHLMQVPQGGAAREVLARLQGVLRNKPPRWLLKRLTVLGDRT
ncbi:MAG: dinitrogenase iron-molybdenum cofactor biosynthesis protein [Polyangiales bacterium]